ncbi:[Fe-Fe] hydrogenase large subunit C-terminal domain-containing protein [Ruminococcus champanellensis]|uniref:Iron only hydrogenase large subunit, C-terminal domain n=1 Tax=Ruminococcus champanellensis (strain DSM 18848 / JCM 17042 / KCTC 15320 / 18P13) TaxID=213810 RepID=D4LB65_RUMC1|nr:[Fe-Fe] hydrogenase large subunit C-terminal domain-containing protein [Ruminococcus champanellensis]CBL16860.1 Iron only hydrogenase large subunit, C-terminal domain [Ruminococcus champanellensis 18P13 = JCM 17042]
MSEFLKLRKTNCKNCYKCIRHCPVKSIRFSGNQAHIVGNECILCGQCFVVCPQNAKEIADATEAVKVLLEGEEPVVASIAPSFIANYGVGIEAMEQALRQLGFAAAEETAIGATYVNRMYEDILRNRKPDVLISSCCHSVNLLIQKHFPQALPYLADVISPMQAHSVDIRRRMPNAHVVFIGPCLSKKDEADHYTGYVDEVMTFEELTRMLEEANIQLEQNVDHNSQSRTRLFPTSGGILKTMEKVPGYQYISVDGIENCIAALHDLEQGGLNNCFIEMSACAGSCIGGPVMEKYHRTPIRDYAAVDAYAGSEDFPIETLPQERIHKEMEAINRKLPQPTETEIFTILRQMGKNKPSDELNCGSCGYNTCREKAIAIYQGKADLTMCLPYLKDRAENFSDHIINNTSNGILVLNESLEVQQINQTACEILNVRHPSDVLGEQVIRIRDPKDFLDVKNGGATIRDRRTYLAEYNKYVDETILYDASYRVLMCMMRDVTEEERQRRTKESIRQQTIETADKVVDKQMRIVQEIASLLGETAAETKIALTKLKGAISDE